MLDFIFPEIPEWRTAKKIIDDMLIGKILNVNVNWTFLSYDLKNNVKSWKTDVEQGGGALSFYFSHVFYYLEYFVGKIQNLQCSLSSSEKRVNEGETVVNMTALFENGCVGNAHLDISSVDKQKHFVEFQGENGSVILQNISSNFVDSFELTINTPNGIQKIQPVITTDSPYDELEDPRVNVVMPIVERFINWCNTGIAAKPDFHDGFRVQKLIAMARDSDQNSKSKYGDVYLQ